MHSPTRVSVLDHLQAVTSYYTSLRMLKGPEEHICLSNKLQNIWICKICKTVKLIILSYKLKSKF